MLLEPIRMYEIMRKTISVSLDEVVIEKLRARATRHNMSVSREVETILKRVFRI